MNDCFSLKWIVPCQESSWKKNRFVFTNGFNYLVQLPAVAFFFLPGFLESSKSLTQVKHVHVHTHLSVVLPFHFVLAVSFKLTSFQLGRKLIDERREFAAKAVLCHVSCLPAVVSSKNGWWLELPRYERGSTYRVTLLYSVSVLFVPVLLLGVKYYVYHGKVMKTFYWDVGYANRTLVHRNANERILCNFDASLCFGKSEGSWVWIASSSVIGGTFLCRLKLMDQFL